MHSRFTPDQLQYMAQHDRGCLKDWFHEYLRDNDHPDPADIAHVLRETRLSLAILGVSGDTPAQASEKSAPVALEASTAGNLYWNKLGQCLRHADPEDALAIFQAMAQSLEEAPMVNFVALMSAAFDSPAWCLQAIKAIPSFFQKQMSHSDPDKSSLWRHPANAFQVLALSNDVDALSGHWARQLLHALRDAGVQDCLHPYSQTTCLHYAAKYLGAEALSVFVEVFPGSMENGDNLERRPLHYAAESNQHENVKCLLDAGAHPHPTTRTGSTPLHYVALNADVKSANVLLDSGAYTDLDVEQACKRIDDDHVAAHLRSYYAAVKAQQALKHSVPAPRPL